MKRYLYFADGNGANATNEAYTANAENVTSVQPISVNTTAIYVAQTEDMEDKIILTHDDTSATTGHRAREIAIAVAEACNAGPHQNGVVDMVDLDNSLYYAGTAASLTFVTGVEVQRGSTVQ